MRVNEDYEVWNAENQVKDENSVHAFWQRLLKIRKDNTVLVSWNLLHRFVILLCDADLRVSQHRLLGTSKTLFVITNASSRMLDNWAINLLWSFSTSETMMFLFSWIHPRFRGHL